MAESVLITGANGEVGHGLIQELAKLKKYEIIALDINDLDDPLKPNVREFIKDSILNKTQIEAALTKNKVSIIFHLAAILSTGAEKNPEQAIEVNSQGTSTLLSGANRVCQKEKRVIKFIFPSSIAVYGVPNLETKTRSGAITEGQFLNPITIYGITKLYCENLGKYFSTNYQLLSTNSQRYLDFRCLRFPGIISAITLPTGGTSDYAPEMIHSAAKGEGDESFVRPNTKIPFMVMPDAIKALIQLAENPKEKLSQKVYNVTSFSVTAENIAQIINKVFPDSAISYNPDEARQKIVDSWPGNIDDSRARTDWGWQPEYDFQKSFSEYLIPEIQNRYNRQ